jgi:hypothetical protein
MVGSCPTKKEIQTMRIKDIHARHILIVLPVILMLTLSACGAGNENTTPTLSVDAIFTAAFQTLSAQQATQLALTPPTQTPPPTSLPTLTALPTQSTGLLLMSPTTSTGGAVGSCNNAAFVKDVTIPDGTAINQGKSFVKTWLIQNTGSCAWSTSYKFSFISGDAMNGSSVVVPNSVPSGQQVQISVTLTAPTSSGNFKGYWRMQTDQGQYFGDSPWVAITVSGAAAATDTPSASTNTPSGPTNTTAPPTNTPTPIVSPP